MNLNRFRGKLKAAKFLLQSKIYPSYSQAGEDQLVRYLFQSLGIEYPNYLDIGANHPYIGNNTFLFYSRGSKGVCIEPDIDLFKSICNHRKGDVILNAAIGPIKGTADLYIFPDPYSGWNTLSKAEAEKRQEESGVKIKKVNKVPVLHINDVMEKHFTGGLNFMSLDVEGIDYEILNSLDFARYSPDVICVETITFSTKQKEEKISDIADLLLSKGYFIFGDTHINTIFCRNGFYKKEQA